ncbi:hypothetical protein C8E97_2127 [Saccharothrix australiensis]|uniref:Uncharacterized protein n=1 Tax=Saccharothrix australiensis TaxID=2072 RepID=A0A495VWD1_9PSEU|nr:hypothetical protein C8E97_2127 [Saccharothrix australiensis]
MGSARRPHGDACATHRSRCCRQCEKRLPPSAGHARGRAGSSSGSVSPLAQGYLLAARVPCRHLRRVPKGSRRSQHRRLPRSRSGGWFGRCPEPSRSAAQHRGWHRSRLFASGATRARRAVRQPADVAVAVQVERGSPAECRAQPEDGVLTGQFLVGMTFPFQHRGHGGLGSHLADEVQVPSDGSHRPVRGPRAVPQVEGGFGIHRSSGYERLATAGQAAVVGPGAQPDDLADRAVLEYAGENGVSPVRVAPGG